MVDATLLELFKQTRQNTMGLLKWFDKLGDAVTFAPEGTNNTILWHAGHALVVVEHLVAMRITRSDEVEYPSDWTDKFDWNSKPATVKSWPSLAEVGAQLTSQYERVCKLIETVTPEHLDSDDQPQSPTVRGSIVHGIHDEAQHQGEMYLLAKLWKARAAVTSHS